MILPTALAAALALCWVAWAARRDTRRRAAHRETEDVARITGGLGTWHDPTPPPESLRAIAWPARLTPTDLAEVYGADYTYTPPPDWDEVLREARAWNWAVAQLAEIVAEAQRCEELIAA